MTTKSRNDKTFPFSRFPDFPKLLAEVSAEKVTNYNVIYIIIYLYIYKYIITLLLVGKTNLGKSGNREIYTFPFVKGVSAILRYSIGTKIIVLKCFQKLAMQTNAQVGLLNHPPALLLA